MRSDLHLKTNHLSTPPISVGSFYTKGLCLLFRFLRPAPRACRALEEDYFLGTGVLADKLV